MRQTSRSAPWLPGSVFGHEWMAPGLGRAIFMPRWFPGFLFGHQIERGWRALGGLLVVATLLELAAALGLASIAGFSRMATVLGHFNWHWLPLLPAAWAVSYVGYYH